ncbi:TPA: hypothetical protein DDW35_05625, partial [Candidatus Sumerlaeota bacterium]|nr:hypothetical protein [Candidatus Sumerlaeota bacterium]
MVIESPVMSSTQAPVNAPLQNLLLDNIRESVIGLNLNGRISYWSAGAVVLHGWTHEDTQDMLWREFGTSSEETIALADKMLERAYNTGSSQEVRHLRRKDGSFFYAETVVHFMRDKVGNSVGYAICDRDITPQRQLAEELRSVEECYRSIVEEQEELICRYNKDLVLTFVNRAYAEFWDKTSEDLVGTSLLELVPVSERDRMRRFYRSFTPENPNRRVEHPVLTSDGAILFQLWRDRAFFDESGELLFFQSVGRDITALRTAEAAMLDAGEREQRRIGQDIHDG